MLDAPSKEVSLWMAYRGCLPQGKEDGVAADLVAAEG
jgi:hypothetical protein